MRDKVVSIYFGGVDLELEEQNALLRANLLLLRVTTALKTQPTCDMMALDSLLSADWFNLVNQ